MLRLAPILSDHAVLLRHRPIILRGEARGRVCASFLGENVETEADGSFELVLSPRPAGGPYTMRISCGGETITLDDLYIGDVILLSGQSNMQLKAAETADFPGIVESDALARVFHAPRPETGDRFDNQWQALTVENAGNWSAIGYYLIPLLRRARGCAVGMVCAYQGAAVIQSFLPPADARRFTFPKEARHPDHDSELYGSWNPPAMLYESMLKPIFPFQVSAVVWYQGESNTSPAEGAVYADMLDALIAAWRGAYRFPALPFTVVQINDFDTPFSKDGWKLVQKAQETVASRTPGVRLVKISDLGQHELIHPVNKKAVAERIFETL